MNNILPGFIDSLPEKEEFIKRIPLKRYGKVSEISSVIEMLASEVERILLDRTFVLMVELLVPFKCLKLYIKIYY